MSYPRFAYSDLRFHKDAVAAGEDIEIALTGENTDDREGAEIVQLYARDLFSSMCRPVKELVGLARVSLLPGERKKVRFVLRTGQLAFLDGDMRWKIEQGEIRMKAGASSEDIRLEGTFRIEGNQWADGKDRGFHTLGTVRQSVPENEGMPNKLRKEGTKVQ